MSLNTHLRIGLAGLLLMGASVTMCDVSASPGDKEKARVSVDCSRSAGMIQVNILNHRKIGNVHMVVKDAQGKTVYIEEGKAMTEELVRRLDKGMFPKGDATLTVEARDFTITQTFTIQ